MNGAILLSAWSAATSDIYVSSRFLFLLARRGHAPQFLAHLVRYPWYETRPAENTEDEDTDDDSSGEDQTELVRFSNEVATQLKLSRASRDRLLHVSKVSLSNSYRDHRLISFFGCRIFSFLSKELLFIQLVSGY